MLLLFVTVSCALFGSSAGIREQMECYGKYLDFPMKYFPVFFKGRLYFTPSNGGPRTLLMDNGELKHPRIRKSYYRVRLTDLTKRDEGTFSASSDNSAPSAFLTLKITDCPDSTVTKTYGDTYDFPAPRDSEFLEFTPPGSVEPEILWNRTNPQTSKGGRGQLSRYGWQLTKIIQADSGFYDFRKKDNTLKSRIQLFVEDARMHYDTKVRKRLLIKYPRGDALWTVTFTPEMGGEYPLMKAGKLIETNEWMGENGFIERIRVLPDGIEIYPVKSSDSGSFEFRDSQGNLAQTATVEVEIDDDDPPPIRVLVGAIVGGFFVLIICCRWLRRYCCTKSSFKRNGSAPQTAAAPAVYYHGGNQPAGPSYSAPAYSYQPTNVSKVLREPAVTSLGPSVNDPVNIHVNPPQPEVAPLGGHGAAPAPSFGSDCLSSNPEPRFEVKGLTLNSDSTFSNVYTSDKLNFL